MLLSGTIAGVPCVLLARHGRKHTVMPTNVNYRANLFALKEVSYLFEHKEAVCGPHILVSFVSLLSLSLSLRASVSLNLDIFVVHL